MPSEPVDYLALIRTKRPSSTHSVVTVPVVRIALGFHSAILLTVSVVQLPRYRARIFSSGGFGGTPSAFVPFVLTPFGVHSAGLATVSLSHVPTNFSSTFSSGGFGGP